MQYLFKEYRIDHVYENINPGLREEIISLWLAAMAFWFRLRLIGGFLKSFSRFTTLPGVFNLAVFAGRRTSDTLGKQESRGRTLPDLIIVMENKQLWRKGMRRVPRSNGCTYWGKEPMKSGMSGLTAA
jgi:hypothetical protein